MCCKNDKISCLWESHVLNGFIIEQFNILTYWIYNRTIQYA